MVKVSLRPRPVPPQGGYGSEDGEVSLYEVVFGHERNAVDVGLEATPLGSLLQVIDDLLAEQPVPTWERGVDFSDDV
jgi:hypothetical protein